MQIEQLNNQRIIIHAVADYTSEKHNLICYNERGSIIKL
jgi:hypothetical protein